MKYLDELEILIEEYIQNIDMNNILNLKILIPNFKGTFHIYTDKQLIGRIDQSINTELCFLFSFKAQSKKSVRFLTKILEGGHMNDFKFKQSNLQVEFVKKTNNDYILILKTVNEIVENIFPDINRDLIKIELARINQWHTLREK